MPRPLTATLWVPGKSYVGFETTGPDCSTKLAICSSLTRHIAPACFGTPKIGNQSALDPADQDPFFGLMGLDDWLYRWRRKGPFNSLSLVIIMATLERNVSKEDRQCHLTGVKYAKESIQLRHFQSGEHDGYERYGNR